MGKTGHLEKGKRFFVHLYSISRKTLFDNRPSDPDYVPLPEDRPGGFDWGDADVQPPDDD